jgi:hypothetical protein
VEVDVPTAGTGSGEEVVLIAGEMLFPDGTVYNQLNGSTNMSLRWTLRGPASGPIETIRPSFVFWAFQHVQVTGWPGDAPPTAESVRGIAISTLSDAHQVGRITSFGGVVPTAAIAHAFRHPAAAAAGASRLQQDDGRFDGPVVQRAGTLNCSILAGGA